MHTQRVIAIVLCLVLLMPMVAQARRVRYGHEPFDRIPSEWRSGFHATSETPLRIRAGKPLFVFESTRVRTMRQSSDRMYPLGMAPTLPDNSRYDGLYWNVEWKIIDFDSI